MGAAMDKCCSDERDRGQRVRFEEGQGSPDAAEEGNMALSEKVEVLRRASMKGETIPGKPEQTPEPELPKGSASADASPKKEPESYSIGADDADAARRFSIEKLMGSDWSQDPATEVREDTAGMAKAEVAEAKVDEAKVDKAKVDEAEVDEAKVDEAKVDEAKGDEANVDEAKVDEAKVDEAKVDEAKVDEAKVDEAKGDEAKVDEAKVDEAKVAEAEAKVAESGLTKTEDDDAAAPVTTPAADVDTSSATTSLPSPESSSAVKAKGARLLKAGLKSGEVSKLVDEKEATDASEAKAPEASTASPKASEASTASPKPRSTSASKVSEKKKTLAAARSKSTASNEEDELFEF